MDADADYTRARAAALAERLHARVHADRTEVDELAVAGPTGRIGPEDAARLAYRPARLGEELGPLFATYWLRCGATVPDAWAGARVDLLFSARAEATLWVDGEPRQGLNETVALAANLGDIFPGEALPERIDAPLVEHARGGEALAFVVEIACTAARGEVAPRPYRTGEPWRLDLCSIARHDGAAERLALDLDVLVALERDVAAADPAWAGRLRAGLVRACVACDPDDPASYPAADAALAPLLAERNAGPAHEITAVGHAHLDTAYLWPVAESVRKALRTVSTQLRLMERYPEYRFACSSALHHAWIEERAPEVFAELRRRAAAGQWIPTGATWVEPDCNLPSGESLVRQFLLGQRWFERAFGMRTAIFWNPDAFGFNGQLPQIMLGAGVRFFLTEKLTWNRYTEPPHHSFVWEGIDGSRVVAHIPPAGTFSAAAEVATLRASARAHRDHDRSGRSLLLFGHGDGGGGPTPRMLELLRRTRDLLAVPRTAQRSPDRFFDELAADLAHDPPAVAGELYLELHRGTYTSQGRLKALNRRLERALHDAEALAAFAHRCGRAPYPRADLHAALRTLLLHQFHDILPGTSIREVVDAAERDLEAACGACEALAAGALAALAEPDADEAPVNTTAHARTDVAPVPGADGALALYESPPYGAGRRRAPAAPVTAERRGDAFVLENGELRAVVGADGAIRSLVHRPTGREALAAPANLLELYEDRPTAFDAWDVDPFHVETARACPPAERADLAAGPLRADVVLERAVGDASRLRQTVRLDADARRLEVRCELDWHERHRLLKAAFPLAVHAAEATYEMQFGVARRPTHASTPADAARFEVPGHRFADLSEHGFGVALLSDVKHGYAARAGVLRLSLVRAPTWPDPEADQGRHAFAYALLPHPGGWQDGGVVAQAASFAAPLHAGRLAAGSLARVEGGLVLDTVKLAEDGDDLVLRLYEPHGGRGRARVLLDPPPRAARRCTLLEDPGEPLAVEAGAIVVPYRPFEIVTVLAAG